MTFIRRFLLVLPLSLLLCAGAAFAQQAVAEQPVVAAAPADPFTVTGIAIDMPVTSPQEARDQALVAAQRQAYQKLKEQVAAASPGTTLPDANDQQLNKLMQTFEVAGERISARRYIGSYTIRFRPAAVQHAASGEIAGAPVDAAATTTASSLVALSRFRLLPDWVETERRLRQTPGVTGVDIAAIGRAYVKVEVRFTGTREALVAALSNADIDLSQNPAVPDQWQLQRRGATL